MGRQDARHVGVVPGGAPTDYKLTTNPHLVLEMEAAAGNPPTTGSLAGAGKRGARGHSAMVRLMPELR